MGRLLYAGGIHVSGGSSPALAAVGAGAGNITNYYIDGIHIPAGDPDVDRFMKKVTDTLGACGFRKGVYR